LLISALQKAYLYVSTKQFRKASNR